MSEPILTVIMSCYNQAKYIRQAIESVLMQKTEFPFQLLITDDHSTKDDSCEIIREYVAKYPDRIIALFNERNGRYLENILRAKARMKTEYFTLLDADDYWTDSDYLQGAVDYLRRNKDYVIYFRNTLCREENGAEYLFLPQDTVASEFSFDDYLAGSVLIPQTTGAVFRNVIFQNGVPETMRDAVGTIHERSFEGDVGRFLMHLAKGKAHYDPQPSGVYRILSSGIWCRLPESEKHMIQAQASVDFSQYFNRGKRFFVANACSKLRIALSSACAELERGVAPSEAWYRYMRDVMEFLSRNASEIEMIANEEQSRCPEKLKDRLRLWLFRRLRSKLEKKGLLS